MASSKWLREFESNVSKKNKASRPRSSVKIASRPGSPDTAPTTRPTTTGGSRSPPLLPSPDELGGALRVRPETAPTRNDFGAFFVPVDRSHHGGSSLAAIQGHRPRCRRRVETISGTRRPGGAGTVHRPLRQPDDKSTTYFGTPIRPAGRGTAGGGGGGPNQTPALGALKDFDDDTLSTAMETQATLSHQSEWLGVPPPGSPVRSLAAHPPTHHPAAAALSAPASPGASLASGSVGVSVGASVSVRGGEDPHPGMSAPHGITVREHVAAMTRGADEGYDTPHTEKRFEVEAAGAEGGEYGDEGEDEDGGEYGGRGRADGSTAPFRDEPPPPLGTRQQVQTQQQPPQQQQQPQQRGRHRRRQPQQQLAPRVPRGAHAVPAPVRSAPWRMAAVDPRNPQSYQGGEGSLRAEDAAALRAATKAEHRAAAAARAAARQGKIEAQRKGASSLASRGASPHRMRRKVVTTGAAPSMLDQIQRTARELPGPGEYDTDSSSSMASLSTKSLQGAFHTYATKSSLELAIERAKETPGPGYVELPTPVPSGGKFSLTTAPSALEAHVAAKRGVPGPGHVRLPDATVSGGAFRTYATKSSLELAIERAKLTPGPGTFDMKSDFDADAKKGGRFKATHGPDEFELLRRRAAREPGPPPAMPAPPRIKGGAMSKGAGTLTAEDFKLRAAAASPGPGAYEHKELERRGSSFALFKPTNPKAAAKFTKAVNTIKSLNRLKQAMESGGAGGGGAGGGGAGGGGAGGGGAGGGGAGGLSGLLAQARASGALDDDGAA